MEGLPQTWKPPRDGSTIPRGSGRLRTAINTAIRGDPADENSLLALMSQDAMIMGNYLED